MRARSAVAAALVAFAAAKVLARGNLLVHKHVSLDDRLPVLALGRNFSVTYGVYNVGQSPAYDIKVKDMWPESSFELLEGKPEASYKSIAAGANETFVVVLRPRVTGVMQSARATVDYKYKTSEACEDEECTIATAAAGAEGDDAADDFEDVTAYSTTPGRVQIMTAEAYDAHPARRGGGGDALTSSLVLLAGGAVSALHFSWWRAAAAKGTAARKTQ